MEIAVHGRHVELSDQLRSHAEVKVGHLARLLHGLEQAEVRFFEQRKGHLAGAICCEVTVAGHGHVVRADNAAPSPEAALEGAVDKAAHRLSRLKTRLVDRSRPRHRAAGLDGTRLAVAEEPDGIGER